MMRRLRIFGSHLSPRERRVYRSVVLFYLFAAAAMLWPIYPMIGRARPLVLGLPLSLFSLICLVLSSFVVQLLLFRWEKRRGALEPPPEDECPPG